MWLETTAKSWMNKETGGSVLTSAEIYNPATGESCSLPELPEERHYHSQNGGLACGGKNRMSTGWYEDCVEWSPASGSWIRHDIREKRIGHVSWASASGVWLIGGTFSLRSSEKVGSPDEGFDLKYDTRLVLSSSRFQVLSPKKAINDILSLTVMRVVWLTRTQRR